LQVRPDSLRLVPRFAGFRFRYLSRVLFPKRLELFCHLPLLF
jgi:hypothetical protein